MIWQPTATIANLKLRAELLQRTREFFAARDVLEVETPLLATCTGTDWALDPFSLDFEGQQLFLQTSPELFMKRLLAADSGDIYQLGKAFRADEQGSKHNPEFTILEWYRTDFDHWQLMTEVNDFLQASLDCPKAEQYSYKSLFEQHCGINPHQTNLEELQEVAYKHELDLPPSLSADDYLMLLFECVIEAKMDPQQPYLVYHYPKSQAALARLVDDDGEQVAARFELYYQGHELANGFWELQDPEQQRQRFEQDNKMRQEILKPELPIAENFLAALDSGLPDCAGVALGFDRLVMLAAEAKEISDVISFR